MNRFSILKTPAPSRLRRGTFRSFRDRSLRAYFAGPVVAWIACAGCSKSERDTPTDPRVTVYCSVDEEFARDILEHFAAETGMQIEPVFDSEAGKTTGLVQRIIAEAEAGRPRGSVLFSSEVFNTILLARRGLLEPYDPPTASDIPSRFRDPEFRWTGMAVRARVLAYDPQRFSDAQPPEQWHQLADPRFARHTAIANPLFGTTRGHVASMFAHWGPQRARKFLSDLRNNGALIVDGNSTAVRALLNDSVQFAMTDTDDVWVAQRKRPSLDLKCLDMGGGGTLLIPSSAAIIKGGPNTDKARALVDYLVSAELERRLAASDSRNIPVRGSLREELGLDWPPDAQIDYHAVADAMDDAVKAVREILIR